MRLSQCSASEPNEPARLDRRTVLKLCAASLSAGALSSVVTSCASKQRILYKGGKVVFNPASPAKLQPAAGEIARALLSFLEQETSNTTAMQQIDRVLKETKVWDSALAGPVAAVDQIGYSVILNGGERGFITLKVYNDSKFVLPLLIRRGVATERVRGMARASSSCMTAGTSTYNTAGEWASSDSQADDPCVGAGHVDMQDLYRLRRDLFSLQDVVLYADVVRKCVEVLETTDEADVTALQSWLEEEEKRVNYDKIFLSTRRDGDVLWVDWMIVFRNGAAGLAQVAKGNIKPFYSTSRPPKNATVLAKASIDTTPMETNVEGIDLAWPHISVAP